jgi:hypothetical protein
MKVCSHTLLHIPCRASEGTRGWTWDGSAGPQGVQPTEKGARVRVGDRAKGMLDLWCPSGWLMEAFSEGWGEGKFGSSTHVLMAVLLYTTWGACLPTEKHIGLAL